MIEKNPRLKKQLDKNKDGVIDQNEMNWGVDRLSKKIRKKDPSWVLGQPKMVFYAVEKNLFIIGEISESEVIKRYSRSTRLSWYQMVLIFALLVGFIFGKKACSEKYCVEVREGYTSCSFSNDNN